MAYVARNGSYPPANPHVIVTQPNMPSKHIVNVVVDNLPGGQHAYSTRKWSTKLCGCFEDCSSCYLHARIVILIMILCSSYIFTTKEGHYNMYFIITGFCKEFAFDLRQPEVLTCFTSTILSLNVNLGFLAMFFPPCFSCYLASRMGELCCLPICVPESLMALRVKLRAGNNIEGSICGDCLLTTFCPTCAMCQIKRELDNIEKGMLMRHSL